jgi:glucokinase
LIVDSPRGDTVGLGVAGCVTLAGIVRGSPNLPALADVPIERVLSQALGLRVLADNDAHCHALAEAWNGAARSWPTFLLLTLGSGIGSALVVDGHVYRGATGYGSELGHMILQRDGRLCACGNRGCVEAYVSETALRGRVAESSLADAVDALVAAERRGLAESLFLLADRGDSSARALVGSLVAELGTALGSAVNVYDVERIVLGGGMAPGFLARMQELRRALGSALFARDESEITIVPARSGALAGAVGAARKAMRGV